MDLILYIIDIENDVNKNKYRIDNWEEIKTIILIISKLTFFIKSNTYNEYRSCK